jgi:hypothetical protein
MIASIHDGGNSGLFWGPTLPKRPLRFWMYCTHPFRNPLATVTRMLHQRVTRCFELMEITVKGAFGGRDIGVVEYWEFAKVTESYPNYPTSRMEWKKVSVATKQTRFHFSSVNGRPRYFGVRIHFQVVAQFRNSGSSKRSVR